MDNLLKINLGCGPHSIEGWLNYDLENQPGVIQRDLARDGIGARANTISYAFSEHFIEHISFDQAVHLLGDTLQALRPEGVLRISTPCLDTLVSDYRSKRLDRFAGTWEPKTACQMMNEGMRLWGHQYLYNEEEFIRLLTIAGFQTSNIYRVQHRKSDYPDLRNLEVRPYCGDLIFEARKPILPQVGPSYHARVPAS